MQFEGIRRTSSKVGRMQISYWKMIHAYLQFDGCMIITKQNTKERLIQLLSRSSGILTFPYSVLFSKGLLLFYFNMSTYRGEREMQFLGYSVTIFSGLLLLIPHTHAVGYQTVLYHLIQLVIMLLSHKPFLILIYFHIYCSFIKNLMGFAGLSVREDAVGNIFGRW